MPEKLDGENQIKYLGSNLTWHAAHLSKNTFGGHSKMSQAVGGSIGRASRKMYIVEQN